MMTHMKVACVQMTSGPEIAENLTQAAVHINEAAKEGAELVITPENTDFVRANANLTLETAKTTDEHPGVKYFSVLAKELGIWILVGSMKVKVADDKVANRSFLYSNTGQLMATYDKIHMFDVDLPNGETYRDSDSTRAGSKAVVAGIDGRKFGLTICYDLRFPHLYRDLAKNGAEIIAAPSAFTATTGQAHWEVLLRARAIETGSFIFAPAQVGKHEGDRKTHGHSMIINPWGKVVAEMNEDKPGFIMHDVNFIEVAKARAAIPALQHDVPYEFLKTNNKIS